MCNTLAVAIVKFRSEYGHFPDLGSDGKTDTVVTQDNYRLLEILRGRESGAKIQNHRGFKFIADRKTKPRFGKLRDGLDPAGNLLDPWGNPYRIHFDSDYDGQLVVKDETLKISTTVWSEAENGRILARYQSAAR